MFPHLPRRRLTGVLAAGGVLIAAATAFAAGQSISLNLKGGYRNETKVACRQRNHYTAYHRGGSASPGRRLVPAGLSVHLLVSGRPVRGRELRERAAESPR